MVLKNKVISLVMCLVVLCITSAFPVFASEQEFLGTEEIIVDGVSVNLDLYNDKGVKVEVVRVNDSICKSRNIYNINERIIKYLEHRDSTVKIKDYSARKNLSEHYYDLGRCSNKRKVMCMHSGTFIAQPLIPPFMLGSEDAYSQGMYSGTGTPDKMKISEVYKFSGIGAVVSWPAPFDFTGNTATWESSDYTNTSCAKAYRLDFSGKNATAIFKLKIACRADVYFNNTCYPASASSQTKIYDWV